MAARPQASRAARPEVGAPPALPAHGLQGWELSRPRPSPANSLLMNNVLLAIVRGAAGVSQESAPDPRLPERWEQVALRSTKPPSGGAGSPGTPPRPGSRTSKQHGEEEGA